MTHDLIVVGSGILGLATAYLAHKQGQTVHVIEAGDRPVESSIQNFGHACFTGQADLIQPVAARARRGWLEAAHDVGFWAAESGTWIPVMTDVEMQVLREFSSHRGEDQARLVGAAEIADALANPGLGAVGGAHLPQDVRVNPREVAPRIVEWLRGEGVDFTWNTQVTGIGDGVVETVRGAFDARYVVACPGYKLMGLFPGLAEDHGVRVCTLAMSLIERPSRLGPEFGMLTGTSLARYAGFAAMESVPELRAELAQREPELVAMIANLMVTGIDAGLLIGDSHAYSLTPEPFIEEDVASTLLDRATSLLGIEAPRVKQRWLGRYSDSATTNLVLERPDEKTTVMVVTSGIGMTLSFGVADLALRGGSVEGF
ncbi:TIGR03364 family FAD-dependent oxidoreductase [Corynebacterium breve]|uniref:TIGR03364 family FAD-dependent oxidoreductase n=1 Tax=Corynebacterium breve TaxID=3049799 RepID=A0ABY8VBS2_9CORY|nr:TIGR03364 family FAD-dependent oxidoreductase [Corynebacterium breve]WIM67121.1 TIGR03364 family FAD-dependent oxidoreductase [Corynebacterium breve]